MLCIDANDLFRKCEYIANALQIKEEKMNAKTENRRPNASPKACNSEKSGIEWWHEP